MDERKSVLTNNQAVENLEQDCHYAKWSTSNGKYIFNAYFGTFVLSRPGDRSSKMVDNCQSCLY